METGTTSDAAHVAALLTAATRGRHDPDAELTLLLGDLERADASGNDGAKSRKAVIDRILTQLASDVHTP